MNLKKPQLQPQSIGKYTHPLRREVAAARAAVVVFPCIYAAAFGDLTYHRASLPRAPALHRWPSGSLQGDWHL